MSKYIAYYQREFGQEIPEPLTIDKLLLYFCPVRNLEANSLEEVYSEMQGENWSPHGEQREYIKSLGIGHTSMSIGDIIFSWDGHKYYMVTNFGFEDLGIRELKSQLK